MLLDGESLAKHGVLRAAAQQARPLHCTAVSDEISGQDAEQGALTGAVLTDDAHQLTRRKVKRHTAQDRTLPVALPYTPHPQHRVKRTHHCTLHIAAHPGPEVLEPSVRPNAFTFSASNGPTTHSRTGDARTGPSPATITAAHRTRMDTRRLGADQVRSTKARWVRPGSHIGQRHAPFASTTQSARRSQHCGVRQERHPLRIRLHAPLPLPHTTPFRPPPRQEPPVPQGSQWPLTWGYDDDEGTPPPPRARASPNQCRRSSLLCRLCSGIIPARRSRRSGCQS